MHNHDYFDSHTVGEYFDMLWHNIMKERARLNEPADHTDLVGYAQALANKGANDV